MIVNEDKSPSQASINCFTPNNFIPRQDFHHNQILDNMKSNFRDHLSILQGDDYPVTLASTTVTQTNMSDVSYNYNSIKSPYDRSNKECSKGRYFHRSEKENASVYTDRNRIAKYQGNSCNNTRERVQTSNKKVVEVEGDIGT